MAERKNLTIIQVKPIEKVGDKQYPKLFFKASDGEGEHWYATFRPNLFELIKEGQTISADVETEVKGEYTNRKVVQIYVDGQPVAVKRGEGYRGKSPEELEQSAKLMVLSYAKDLAVADKIVVVEIINQADVFYNWVKKSGLQKPIIVTGSHTDSTSLPGTSKISDDEAWEKMGKESPSGKAIPNVTDFKRLLMSHKIPTHEAYIILSIKSYDELKDLDKAWEDIKKAKGI